MKKNKGISLIVLIITILVMVILGGTIVLTLNNNGTIKQAQNAVKQYNLSEIKNLASLAWAEAYIDGKTTQEQLESEVLKVLNEEKIDLTLYDVIVTQEGVEVKNKWVIATVDGVPIPRGFVASQVTGEDTKNGGLVIYEGTEPVTSDNVEKAKRTRNQYVWVPVSKADFTTKFVRGAHNNITYSNTLGSNYWEVVLDTTTNMPLPTQDTDYVTSTTLAEVQAMYESIKQYEGFYIGRYEAGIDNQRTEENYIDGDDNIILAKKVYSVMGKIPYYYIPWAKESDNFADDVGGAVQVARSIYPSTNTDYGVVSTMTYAVQWDRTLAWWLEVGAKDGNENTITDLTDSTNYGNYANHVIEAGDLNDGAKYATTASGYSLNSYQSATSTSTKASGTKWALSTGALKAAKVNNIYDMAGNMWEWTMEGGATSFRVFRGGCFWFECSGSTKYPVGFRRTGGIDLAQLLTTDYIGFRPSLYIKK